MRARVLTTIRVHTEQKTVSFSILSPGVGQAIRFIYLLFLFLWMASSFARFQIKRTKKMFISFTYLRIFWGRFEWMKLAECQSSSIPTRCSFQFVQFGQKCWRKKKPISIMAITRIWSFATNFIPVFFLQHQQITHLYLSRPRARQSHSIFWFSNDFPMASQIGRHCKARPSAPQRRFGNKPALSHMPIGTNAKAHRFLHGFRSHSTLVCVVERGSQMQ